MCANSEVVGVGEPFSKVEDVGGLQTLTTQAEEPSMATAVEDPVVELMLEPASETGLHLSSLVWVSFPTQLGQNK